MGSSWHTSLLHWSITWPLYMHAVLHACNWYCKFYWHVTIYTEGICFPEDSWGILSPAGNWIHNYNNVIPLEYTSFLFLRGWNKKCDQPDCHILKRSTAPPRLQILPLPPILPQSHDKNLLPKKITSKTAPSPRVEPVVQHLSVQIISSPPHPLQEWSLQNPLAWINIQIHGLTIAKNKWTLQILQTKKKQMAPRNFQDQLCSSMCNIGTNFCNQSAQELVAYHLLKFLHALHIYNKQGKKETIYTVLMGGDSDTSWK